MHKVRRQSRAKANRSRSQVGTLAAPASATPAAMARAWRRFDSPLRIAAFFGLFYLGLERWVDVGLIYHGGGVVRDFPVFFWGGDYFRERVVVPGGVVEYLSALLAQSLFHSWWGALVLTSQALLMFAAAREFLGLLDAGKLRESSYLLPLTLLGLYSDYRHDSVPVTTLVVALVCLWQHARMSSARLGIRVAILAVVSAGLYAAAPGALPVFAVAATGAEVIRRGPTAMIVLPLVLGALVTQWEGTLLFGLAPGEAWGQLAAFPWDRQVLANRGPALLGALYLWVPGVVMARLAYGAATAKLAARGTRAAAPGHATRPTNPGSGREPGAEIAPSVVGSSEGRPAVLAGLRSAAGSVSLLLVTVFILYFGIDSRLKAVIATDYSACHRMWSQVLEASRGNPNHLYVLSAVTQATYHLGRLPRALPLVRTPADLLLLDQGGSGHWRRGELCFDLGYVNMALHHFIEAVELWGERPFLLRRLVHLNLALGNVPTARIYLNALARVPFHGGWAREHLTRLEADPGLARDAEVARLVSIMPRRDSVVRLSAEDTLLLLLDANIKNRMAYEYLMTYYLLSKNLSGFATNLSRLGDFPGFEVSSLWEEAVVLAASSQGPHPSLVGRALDRRAQLRLETILETIKACGGDRELARSRLANDYDRSYLDYYYFHR